MSAEYDENSEFNEDFENIKGAITNESFILLEKGRAEGEWLSERLEQVISRYAEIMNNTADPVFSEAELNALMDAHHVTSHTEAYIIRFLQYNVQDFPASLLAEKWGINPYVLTEKLKSLSAAQSCALLEHLQEQWVKN